MATERYGANYDRAYNDNGKYDIGDNGGRVRVLHDTYTLPADLADDDTIVIGKLPKGARVISAMMKSADLGGSGTLNLGYQANEDDAADEDGFIVAGDHSGQASQTSGSGAGILKKFESETIVQVQADGVTSGATGVVLKVLIQYVVE